MAAAGALGLVWAQKSRWLLSSCWEEDSHSRVLKKKKAPCLSKALEVLSFLHLVLVCE